MYSTFNITVSGTATIEQIKIHTNEDKKPWKKQNKFALTVVLNIL